MAGRTQEGLKGLDKVLKNLTQEATKIEGRSLKGLIRGAIIIQRSTLKDPPTTPIEEGNLRAGFFIVTYKGALKEGASPNFKGEGAAQAINSHSDTLASAAAEIGASSYPALMLGYSADYAAWVHEMVGEMINWTKEGSGAKWFEASIKKTTGEVLVVIAEEAKIK